MTTEAPDRILFRRLARRLLPAAIAIGLLIGVALPAIYYVLQARALETAAHRYAVAMAEHFRGLILDAPDLWKYQTYKYAAMLDDLVAATDVASVRVLDERGQSITGYRFVGEPPVPRWWPATPRGSAPIVFNNRPMGAVQVCLSNRTLVARTVSVAGLAGVVGVGLAAFVFFFPVRTVSRMEQHILGLVESVERSNTELTRLLAQSRRQHREAVELAQVAVEITSSLDRTLVLERIVERGRALCGADFAVLATMEPGRDDLTILAASGTRTVDRLPLRFRCLRSPVSDRLDPIVACAIADCRTDPRLTDEDRALAAAEGAVACVVVPVALRGLGRGLLAAGQRTPRAWTAEETETLARLATHAAIALENARLYDERGRFAQQEERQRIAYELHDGIAQVIVTAKQHIDTALALGREDPVRAESEARVAVSRLAHALAETRRILHALAPLAVEAEGLARALRDALADAARDNGWVTAFAEDLTTPLPAGVETAVFRTAQEALTNAARHARASRVEVDVRETDGGLVLEVRDDGVGFEEGTGRPGGLGLASMHERAELLGGACAVESQPGLGTRVVFRVPIAGTVSTA